MFSRCIFCHVEFGRNEVVEQFPVGTRVAFDPSRGRLWAVCHACHRWSLAPIEERWEALEELDKLATDRGRLLSRTDNISLIRVGDVDVVRVGSARLVEEAWWRYGRELTQRRSRYRTVSWIEGGAQLAVMLALGGFFYLGPGDTLHNLLRWRRFGSVAWRGTAVCPNCGQALTELRFKRTKDVIVKAAAEAGEGIVLAVRCTRCRFYDAAGRIQIGGLAAQHSFRRILAHRHFAGASEKRIKEATGLIDSAGGSGRATRDILQTPIRLEELYGKASRTRSIALEIALNDDAERELLQLELAALEARWREEEELAAIVDGELTPLPPLERLRRLTLRDG